MRTPIFFSKPLALGLGILLSSIWILVSCTKREAEDPTRLIVAIGAEPNTLDPRFATDAYGMRISALLFNSLVRIDSDLKVVGDAAESWNYQDLVYTFQLRPGLAFSNGRPLRREDILFSFEQYQSPSSPFASSLEVIDKVEVEHKDKEDPDSPLIVRLFLKEFSAKLLTADLPIVRILPKEETQSAGAEFSRNLIGTGSFVLERQSSNEIVLRSRQDHSHAAPPYERLVFKIIRDDFTRFQRTLKGEVDIAQAEIPLARVSDFVKQPDRFEVHKYPGLAMSYILVNLKDPILSQKPVRKAIAQALNRQEIIQYQLEGLATEATSILTPTNPFFASDLENPAYEPSLAKQAFKELGLGQQEITLKTSNSQAAVANARVIGQQLREAGLNLRLQSFEWGTFYGDIVKGQFQLALMRWVGVMDPDIYRLAFHSSEKPPGRNRGSYVNTDLDQLLEKGLSIEDPQKRVAHYHQVQRIVHQDLAIIPLWYDQQVAVVNRRVQNFKPSQSGDYFPFIWVSKN